jgi:hypothetical protein
MSDSRTGSRPDSTTGSRPDSSTDTKATPQTDPMAVRVQGLVSVEGKCGPQNSVGVVPVQLHWEYLIENWPGLGTFSISQIQERFDQLGAARWELVTVTAGACMVFKRPEFTP